MDLETAVSRMIDLFGSDRNMNSAKLELYLEDLEDLPESLIVAAISRLRKTSKFLPSVSEIRGLVVEAVSGLPTEDEAWDLVRYCMATRTAGDGKGPWDVPPMVLDVVKLIGTHELRENQWGNKPGSAEFRFRAEYTKRRTKALGDAQAGIAPLAMIAEPTLIGIAS